MVIRTKGDAKVSVDRKTPDTFIEAFQPGDNPFAISISKIFPPEVKDAFAKKAYLIKLRLVLNMPADDWKYFTKVADTLKRAKMFCSIWTPEVGDVVVDDYGCYIEMVSYLRIGTEDKLVLLDSIIAASPEFGTGTGHAHRTEEDAKFVETFVGRVKAGDNLETAMERTKEVVPVPSERPVERLTAGKYVIGKTVVVQGKVADQLQDAEDRVEEGLEEERGKERRKR